MQLINAHLTDTIPRGESLPPFPSYFVPYTQKGMGCLVSRQDEHRAQEARSAPSKVEEGRVWSLGLSGRLGGPSVRAKEPLVRWAGLI